MMNNYIYIYLIAITLLNIYLLLKVKRLSFSLKIHGESLVAICKNMMILNENQHILKGKQK